MKNKVVTIGCKEGDNVKIKNEHSRINRNKEKQSRAEQNRAEQNRRGQDRIGQYRIELKRSKQNEGEGGRTEQN